MKKISILAGSLFVAGMWACKTTQTTQPVIGSIGGDPIYANEFTYVYNKNNSNSEDAYSSESIQEYLRLYTNFRLKVKAAEELGLDTAASFKKELGGYKKQLAQPYFTEKEVTDKFTKISYERLKEEINASHILISVAEEANPQDTIAAWEKIQEIRRRAKKGEDFGKLAMELSEDPSAKDNKGNLGYFTALQMVYPFEDAAYATEVGEISYPVRSRFGYHILKVHDRRPSQGEVKVAHLMVRATEGMSASDSVAAKQKIDELYKKLQGGESWNGLVQQFSDDISTRGKGGELKWFGTGRMIPSFEEVAFNLEESGQFSEPVQTPYGWHIIKLIEKRGLASFEEMEEKIRSKVARDRSEVNKQVLVSRLKRENNFEEYPFVIRKFVNEADSSVLKGEWKAPEGISSDAVLFVIQDEKFTSGQFFDFVQKSQKPKSGVSPQTYMNSLYETFKEKSLIDYEERHLGEKYEDYKMLVREYRDGILLFQLMDEKVWSKAIEDSTGLKKFFKENIDKYQWQERADAVVFNAADSATLAKVKESLSKDFYSANEPELESVYFAENSDSLTKENIKKLNKLVPYLINKKEYAVKLSGGASSKEGRDLAAKRVRNVREYLASKNVDTVKIVLGESTADKNSKEDNLSQKVSFELLSSSAKALEKAFNKKAPLTLQVTEGRFQKGENEIIDSVEWKADTSVIEKDGRFYLVVIKGVEAPRAKKLDETRGLVISDYQEYLEEQWIAELRKKFAVNIKQEEVQKLVKKK